MRVLVFGALVLCKASPAAALETDWDGVALSRSTIGQRAASEFAVPYEWDGKPSGNEVLAETRIGCSSALDNFEFDDSAGSLFGSIGASLQPSSGGKKEWLSAEQGIPEKCMFTLNSGNGKTSILIVTPFGDYVWDVRLTRWEDTGGGPFWGITIPMSEGPTLRLGIKQ